MEWKWITGGSPEQYWGVVIREEWMDTEWQNPSTRSRGVWMSWLMYTSDPGSPGVDQVLVVLHPAEKYLNQWFLRGQEVHEVQVPILEVVERRYGHCICQKARQLSWACLQSPLHSSLPETWVRLCVPKIQFYKGLGSSKLLQKIGDWRGGEKEGCNSILPDFSNLLPRITQS